MAFRYYAVRSYAFSNCLLKGTFCHIFYTCVELLHYVTKPSDFESLWCKIFTAYRHCVLPSSSATNLRLDNCMCLSDSVFCGSSSLVFSIFFKTTSASFLLTFESLETHSLFLFLFRFSSPRFMRISQTFTDLTVIWSRTSENIKTAPVTGGSRLSRIFWEHENLSDLMSNPTY